MLASKRNISLFPRNSIFQSSYSSKMAFFKRFFQRTVEKLRRSSKRKTDVEIPVEDPSLDEEHRRFQAEPTATTESEVLPVRKMPSDEKDQTSRQLPTGKAEQSENKPGHIPVNFQYPNIVIQTSNAKELDVDNPKINAEQDKRIQGGVLPKEEEFSSLLPQPERKKMAFFSIQSLPCRQSLHHLQKTSRDQKQAKLFRFPKKCKCNWCAPGSPFATKCRGCVESYIPETTVPTNKMRLPFECKCHWCQAKSFACFGCGRLIKQTTYSKL